MSNEIIELDELAVLCVFGRRNVSKRYAFFSFLLVVTLKDGVESRALFQTGFLEEEADEEEDEDGAMMVLFSKSDKMEYQF